MNRGEMERLPIALLSELLDEINKRIKTTENEKEVQIIGEIAGNIISPYSYSEEFIKLKKKEKIVKKKKKAKNNLEEDYKPILTSPFLESPFLRNIFEETDLIKNFIERLYTSEESKTYFIIGKLILYGSILVTREAINVVFKSNIFEGIWFLLRNTQLENENEKDEFDDFESWIEGNTFGEKTLNVAMWALENIESKRFYNGKDLINHHNEMIKKYKIEDLLKQIFTEKREIDEIKNEPGERKGKGKIPISIRVNAMTSYHILYINVYNSFNECSEVFSGAFEIIENLVCGQKKLSKKEKISVLQMLKDMYFISSSYCLKNKND